MHDVLIQAIWLVPVGLVAVLVGVWFVRPIITTVVIDYRWRYRRFKARHHAQMLTLNPRVRRDSHRRTRKTR